MASRDNGNESLPLHPALPPINSKELSGAAGKSPVPEAFIPSDFVVSRPLTSSSAFTSKSGVSLASAAAKQNGGVQRELSSLSRQPRRHGHSSHPRARMSSPTAGSGKTLLQREFSSSEQLLKAVLGPPEKEDTTSQQVFQALIAGHAVGQNDPTDLAESSTEKREMTSCSLVPRHAESSFRRC